MEEKYMKLALKEAEKAYLLNEVPIGAVIVYKNKIVGRGYNQKEKTQNALKHAEMIAIKKACSKLKSWRLDDCVMYVTLEPCAMCKGAIAEARIKKVIYALKSKYNEHLFEKVNISEYSNINTECLKILQDFFAKKREKSKDVML